MIAALVGSLTFILGLLCGFILGGSFVLWRAKSGEYVHLGVAPSPWYFGLRGAFFEWRQEENETTSEALSLALAAHKPRPEAVFEYEEPEEPEPPAEAGVLVTWTPVQPKMTAAERERWARVFRTPPGEKIDEPPVSPPRA